MKKNDILEKFGGNYQADDNILKMGIDHRITHEIAKRFTHLDVLETCTGGGFTTIALAKEARSVITIEINKSIQDKAKKNVQSTGLMNKVTFICGDALDRTLLASLPPIDAAFLDPDWADTSDNHNYTFMNSNTKPPVDILLSIVLTYTQNVALILPPFIDKHEFTDLPHFELQNIYLDGELVLFCLYFGKLIHTQKETNLVID